MDIGQALRPLGPVDSAPLRQAVLAQEPAAWNENDSRQRAFEVHRHTESIILYFCDGWPEIEVSTHTGWQRLGAVAQPLMEQIIATHYPPGGRIIRAMAAKLKAGGRIDPHRDSHPSFAVGHRIHVPVSTNPGVQFTVGGKPCPMTIGEAFEINNQQTHSVLNMGRDDRISFIFDYVPPHSDPSVTTR